MNPELLNILACPIDKHYPLEPQFFTWKTPTEVNEGILYCSKCERWYPIGSTIETIPELLPDELRDKEQDFKWFTKWKNMIPKKIKLRWGDT